VNAGSRKRTIALHGCRSTRVAAPARTPVGRLTSDAKVYLA
jgi:hypothetical protein